MSDFAAAFVSWQMGGGPREVTDSWEHRWWDNLHWKRYAVTLSLFPPNQSNRRLVRIGRLLLQPGPIPS